MIGEAVHAEGEKSIFADTYSTHLLWALILIMRALVPPPNTIALGVRISTYEFGWDTDLQTMAEH